MDSKTVKITKRTTATPLKTARMSKDTRCKLDKQMGVNKKSQSGLTQNQKDRERIFSQILKTNTSILDFFKIQQDQDHELEMHREGFIAYNPEEEELMEDHQESTQESEPETPPQQQPRGFDLMD